jgi:CIC family chloride channel protein
LFELTGEYTIILPLMAAIVLATGVSHLLSHDTIYTLKLRRRGIDLDQAEHSTALSTTTVSEVMDPLGPTLPAQTSLIQAAGHLARAPHAQLPVTDRDGSYAGIITARTVADTLADAEHDHQDASSVLEQPTAVRADQTLDAALDVLETAGAAAIPVLDDTGANLVGWLTHQRVLAALRRDLS